MLTIRLAAASDLDAVAELWHESASRMDDGPAQMPSCAELRHRIDVELRSGWELHVAVMAGRIVGMLAIKPADAVLDQLFVLPAAQRSGVGKALLDRVKRAMPACFRLRMAAVNERAARFYEKEGLTMLGGGEHPQSGKPVRYWGWGAA